MNASDIPATSRANRSPCVNTTSQTPTADQLYTGYSHPLPTTETDINPEVQVKYAATLATILALCVCLIAIVEAYSNHDK
jgi:hypothetical protein